MLSYRHSFHAGNAADVLKHLTLIFCLEYLVQKEKPLLCVDTHAGAGLYSPGETGGALNREWQNGIGRLGAYAAGSRGNPPAPVARYLELVRAGRGAVPGSPLLAAKLLREKDRLVCFELHPRDFAELAKNAAAFKGGGEKTPAIETRKEDGPASLKALLPPPSRRGLIFIDPPWEEKAEYETIPHAVAEGLKRFPGGTFLVWYPLLAKQKTDTTDSVGEILFRLGETKRCRLELYTGAAESSFAPAKADASTGALADAVLRSPRGMYGSGLVVFNPPWTLKAGLEQSLPYLAAALGQDKGGWRLDWEGD